MISEKANKTQANKAHISYDAQKGCKKLSFFKGKDLPGDKNPEEDSGKEDLREERNPNEEELRGEKDKELKEEKTEKEEKRQD